MHAHKTAKADCAFLHKTHIHSHLSFITLFHRPRSRRMASQKPIVRHYENVVIIRSLPARFASVMALTVETNYFQHLGRSNFEL